MMRGGTEGDPQGMLQKSQKKKRKTEDEGNEKHAAEDKGSRSGHLPKSAVLFSSFRERGGWPSAYRKLCFSGSCSYCWTVVSDLL